MPTNEWAKLNMAVDKNTRALQELLKQLKETSRLLTVMNNNLVEIYKKQVEKPDAEE